MFEYNLLIYCSNVNKIIKKNVQWNQIFNQSNVSYLIVSGELKYEKKNQRENLRNILEMHICLFFPELKNADIRISG